MAIDVSMVRELRDRTGAGIMDCKSALGEVGGDMDKAVDVLRKRGVDAAESKVGRKLAEGRIGSYIHFGGRVGVLLEMGCESDFVAKTQEFQNLMKNICMHIAASDPQYVSRDEVAKEVLEKEREVYSAQFSDKPAHMIGKIVEGKLGSFFKEKCLLEQPYVRDEDITVEEHVKGNVGKFGENIKVRRFARFGLGD